MLLDKFQAMAAVQSELAELEVMEFIEKIEDHFDISIPLNILPDVNTIGELAHKVHELNL